MQALFQKIRDRRLARAGQAGEPEDAGLLILQFRMGGFVDLQSLPGNVSCPAESVFDHARGDGVFRRPVDQDKRSGFAIIGIRFW